MYVHDVIDMCVRSQNPEETVKFLQQFYCLFGFNSEDLKKFFDEIDEYKSLIQGFVEKSYHERSLPEDHKTIQSCTQFCYRWAQYCYWQSETFYQLIRTNGSDAKRLKRSTKTFLG